MKIVNINNTYYLKQNDTSTQIEMRILDDMDAPLDLVGKTVQVVIGDAIGRLLVKEATPLPGIGELEWGLDAGDILPSGDLRLELYIYDEVGDVIVAPSKGFYKLRIQQSIDSLQGDVTTVTLQYFQMQYDEFIANSGIILDHIQETYENAEIAVGNSQKAVIDSEKAIAETVKLLNRADDVLDAENIRVGSENTRIANENTRKAAETVRETSEATRVTDEGTRKSSENTRISSEATRVTNENVRKENEDVRKTQEAKRQTDTQAAITRANETSNHAETQGNYAKEQGDSVASKQGSIDQAISSGSYIEGRRSAIEAAITKSDVAKVESGQAVVTSNQAKVISETVQGQFNQVVAEAGTNNPEVVQARGGKVNLNERLNEFTTQLANTDRQTSVLGTGTSVVSASGSSLVSTEVEGRTLTSLGNSNLEANKKYVLADKKTKVIVDGATQSGVAKFTKGTTTVSTANFVGKVSGSTVVNPHVIKGLSAQSTTLQPPTGSWGNINQLDTDRLKALDGTYFMDSHSNNGSIVQTLFSFDIIAEIERKLGLIPRTTLAEKVQWVKDNVETLVANWHGFGSSVGGNKANFGVYRNTDNSWDSVKTTTNSTVTKLINTMSVISTRIDDNGFAHFLAYAEPSDSVVPSTINTDYIDLVITLKATAQLNTRPTIIRVENFEGKVVGSTVENPHSVSSSASYSTLLIPSNVNWSAFNQSQYDVIKTLDGITRITSSSSQISQQLFSFNLIEAVERNIGRIPRTTVADKVAWLKVNVAKLTGNWHGFGSSVGGNKATFARWNPTSSTYSYSKTNTTSLPSAVSLADNTSYIDSNGFMHYLAHAEASDSIIPSVINTDYVDLEIEMKPNADFTQPKVALYEVDDIAYNKILVDWNADDVVNRFPIVENTQHLQGVGVIAEGENLLPPFTEWNLHANAKVVSPYELELNATGSGQVSYVFIPVVSGQTYYLNSIRNGSIRAYKGRSVSGVDIVLSNNGSFTVDSTYNGFVTVGLLGDVTGKFTFSNPMLTLGSIAKPFVPRNPSYLFADVKLGAIGSTRDYLYEQDGRWLLRKSVEKDVVLDGILGWTFDANRTGFKWVKLTLAPEPQNFGEGYMSKYNGKSIENRKGDSAKDYSDLFHLYNNGSSNKIVVIRVSNNDTGFEDVYTPTAPDIKRYMNGWKYSDGVTWTSVTGNGQTATAQIALDTKPTDYIPYKLSYVLATPQIVDVTDKVEGALKVGGVTQVEVVSGVVVREVAKPKLDNSYYFIANNTGSTFWGTSQTKYKVGSYVAIFKNGVRDYMWKPSSGNFMQISQTNFDTKAEYTVTYLALDKPKLTVNPTNVKLTYANSVRNALDDAVSVLQDNKTMLSIHEKAIIDLYIRVKALEVK